MPVYFIPEKERRMSFQLPVFTRSVYSQRMFSSLRSRWAMPAEQHSLHEEKYIRNPQTAIERVLGVLPLVCRKSSAWAMSLTTLLASSSSKYFRFWMCVRMVPEGREDSCCGNLPIYKEERKLIISFNCKFVLTTTQLFKHQIKAAAVFKEMDQFQNVAE